LAWVFARVERRKEGGMKEVVGECEMCFTETKLVETEDGWPKRKAMLCNICRGTWAGNAFFWPRQYGFSETAILKSISSVTNMILEAIEKMLLRIPTDNNN